MRRVSVIGLSAHRPRALVSRRPRHSSPSSAPPTRSKRGLKSAISRARSKSTDNVYTYEDFHAGDEKFTTTNMFVVTDDGVLVADGQGSTGGDQGTRRRDRQGHA